jgi:hypothetical protein
VTGSGSLLGRRRPCCIEDVETKEFSERMLSRLDVRLREDAAGVYMVIAIGICDGFASESPDCGLEGIDSIVPMKLLT